MTINKNHIIFIILLSLLITSQIIVILDNQDNYIHKYDYKSYKKVAKTFIGQNTTIRNRDWQYPPLYSILIIPTLFIDENNYLMFFQLICSVIAFYFLFLFCDMFVSKQKAMLISFFVIYFSPAFIVTRIGMPIGLSSMLFIIFCYYLYKYSFYSYINSSITFLLLILTKYLFIALVPFIIYWLYINYKSTIKFFIPPLVLLCIWFVRNAFLYGFSVKGIIGGYYHIDLNLSLVPQKIAFLFTDNSAIFIILIYITFLVSYLFLFKFTEQKHNKYFIFNSLLLLYLITTFFMFGFLYDVDGFRIRYFIYQTPVIFSLAFINIIYIDKLKG